jgi:hypothetical protein
VREGEPGQHHDLYTDSDQQKGGSMKRLVLLLAVMGTTLALAAGMALAQATTETFTEKVPYNETIFNPCTQEDVQLTGDVQFLVHETVDANGGFHVQIHASAQGITGTGLESGTQYRLVGVDRQAYYFAPGVQPRAVTFINHLSLVSNGSSDNALETLTSHVTFNANGEPTVLFERTDITCAG